MSKRHPSRTDSKRWALLRLRVFTRDNWRCAKCGHAGRLECDHIRRAGDPWDMANLQSLCIACHAAKTRAELRRPPTKAERRWRAFVAELRE